MSLSETALNAAADAIATAITHIGLADSSAEVTGGSYARQAVTFGSASSGVASMTGTEEFDVPGGEACDRVILKGHSSNSTPDLGFATFDEETFGSDGTLTVNSLTITVTAA